MRVILKLFFLAVVAAGAWFAWELLVPIAPKQPTNLLLQPGWSSRHIAQALQEAGAVRNARVFLVYHYVSGRTLKAGEYRFDGAATTIDVHKRIVRGDVLVHTVVVPEGFNLYDIAAAMEQAGLTKRQDFIRAAQGNVVLVKDLDPAAQSLEGYLFPDTYTFTRTQSVGDMIAVMVHRFRQEYERIRLGSPCSGVPYGMAAQGVAGPPACDTHLVVTMASIVEKETAVAQERPEVASVYYNRLEKHMPLAADPSVIYAALLEGRYTGVIHQSDLQADSPYNTYRHAGLPPGPIANPGRASLEAALKPAQT
ncbi:MAG TPA: endolytic transglycosylase MltG, partial [Terriglobales bacterium]|nr:endolytic transglycosylase MltG [Terriglobales bacterium]